MKLKTAQVAEKLGITDRHVRRLISDNLLPAERVGKEWVVDERAILLYQEGTTKKIKEVMDELSKTSDVFIASPETIEALRKKNLPINSSVLTYDDYLEQLFKDKKEEAEIRIKNLPLLDESLASPIASSLYNEFRECYLLGIDGAAITLVIILLEYAMKYKILEKKIETDSNAGWADVEQLSFKQSVKALREFEVIDDYTEADLLSFNDNIRNNYIHYKIKELVKDMYIKELPRLNVFTGELEILRDVYVKDVPEIWFSAKKKLDRTQVRAMTQFCIEWVNKLLK